MGGRLSTCVIVITGASTGIGRAAALEFASLGATVALVARRAHVLERLARECESCGGRALALPADVTDAEAVRASAARVVDAFGTIDVWINNAAVTLFGRLEDVPLEAYRRIIDTNFFGYVHGARAVLPYFRDRGRGTLINLSSVAGRIGQPYTSAYNASKAAISALSKSLRMELVDAPHIHVCSVLPASIDTPIFRHGANYSGRAVRPVPPVYSPWSVARALVSLVRQPRREVVVGAAGKSGLAVNALVPALVERALPRYVDRAHFEARAAGPSEGNLFTPMDRFESASGGWRVGHRGRTPIVLTATAAAFGLAAGLWLALARGR